MAVYDYVIIGAGSAGCVLASRLSENPSTRVLLLEAGPQDEADEIHIPAALNLLFQSTYDWDFRTAPQQRAAGRSIYWPRGRMLGGSSSMNAMIYIRGNRADYDTWRDAYGATGWGFDDVLPAFVRSEGNTRLGGPFHGQDGPLHVEDRRYTPGLLTGCDFQRAVAGGSRQSACAHALLWGPQQASWCRDEAATIISRRTRRPTPELAESLTRSTESTFGLCAMSGVLTPTRLRPPGSSRP